MTNSVCEDVFINLPLDIERSIGYNIMSKYSEILMWALSFLRNMLSVPSERDRVRAISTLLVRMAIHEAEGNDHEVELCSLGINALLA